MRVTSGHSFDRRSHLPYGRACCCAAASRRAHNALWYFFTAYHAQSLRAQTTGAARPSPRNICTTLFSPSHAPHCLREHVFLLYIHCNGATSLPVTFYAAFAKKQNFPCSVYHKTNSDMHFPFCLHAHPVTPIHSSACIHSVLQLL